MAKFNDKFEDQNNNRGKGKKNNRNANNRGSRKGFDRDPRDLPDRKEKDSDDYYKSDDPRVLSSCGSPNDPSWYNRNMRLLTDVTKIPFSTVGGLRQLTSPHYSKEAFARFRAPGVCTLYDVCVPGLASTATDGLNMASIQLFQFVRKDLSTYAPYAQADMGMYVMGIDNILMMYAHISRLFGLANLYSSINLYYPRDVIKAIYGWDDRDYQVFINDINNFRGRFNLLIKKASALYLPVDFTIVTRHAWLYSNVFTDGQTAKSQLYAHTPASVYILDETSSKQGTSLQCFALYHWDKDRHVPHVGDEVDGQSAHNYRTIDGLLGLFDRMIEAYRSSDSMNNIAADMRRAFKERPSWKLELIGEDYTIMPTYSEEVLMQIENTTIMPSPFVAGKQTSSTETADQYDLLFPGFGITQSVEDNVILFEPVWSGDLFDDGTSAEHTHYIDARFLNARTQNPTADDIAVMTRDVLFATNLQGQGRLTSCGSEIIVGCVMHGCPFEEATDGRLGYITFQKTNRNVIVSAWSAFDWAPWYCAPTVSADLGKPWTPYCDLDNYVFVEPETIDRMHNNIIMNMWSLPQFGMIDQ